MARSKNQRNGRLEEAMANMLQNQAILVQTQAAFVARMAETDASMAANDAQMAETNRINSERFARIEAMLLDHTRILNDHNRILQALTDAIREKIGFKVVNPTGPAE